MGIREDVIEQLLKAPQEIEEAEICCIDEQVRLDKLKRIGLASARLNLQQWEFEACAIAYGLDDPKIAKVRGRNVEIRKVELGRFLTQDRGMIAAQEIVDAVAKDIATAEAALARLEAVLHGRQNALRAMLALAQLLGGRDD